MLGVVSDWPGAVPTGASSDAPVDCRCGALLGAVDPSPGVYVLGMGVAGAGESGALPEPGWLLPLAGSAPEPDVTLGTTALEGGAELGTVIERLSKLVDGAGAELPGCTADCTGADLDVEPDWEAPFEPVVGKAEDCPPLAALAPVKSDRPDDGNAPRPK
jgi:hypothetical protein